MDHAVNASVSQAFLHGVGSSFRDIPSRINAHSLPTENTRLFAICHSKRNGWVPSLTWMGPIPCMDRLKSYHSRRHALGASTLKVESCIIAQGQAFQYIEPRVSANQTSRIERSAPLARVIASIIHRADAMEWVHCRPVIPRIRRQIW